MPGDKGQCKLLLREVFHNWARAGQRVCLMCNKACLHLKQEACQPSHASDNSLSVSNEGDLHNSLKEFHALLEMLGE